MRTVETGLRRIIELLGVLGAVLALLGIPLGVLLLLRAWAVERATLTGGWAFYSGGILITGVYLVGRGVRLLMEHYRRDRLSGVRPTASEWYGWLTEDDGLGKTFALAAWGGALWVNGALFWPVTALYLGAKAYDDRRQARRLSGDAETKEEEELLTAIREDKRVPSGPE